MATATQLDMFQLANDPVQNELFQVRSSMHNLRRSFFARFDVMQKEINELKEQVHQVNPQVLS